MHYVININEKTLFYFLFLALRRKQVFVLGVDPLFPPLNRLISAVVDRTVRAGRARYALELCPEFEHVIEHPATIYLYNIFEETEDWLNQYYGFQDADRADRGYAMAYKQITCNYTRLKYLPVLLLESIIDRLPPEKVKIVGLLPDTLQLFGVYFGRDIASAVRLTRAPKALVNSCQAILMTVYALTWVVWHTRRLSGNPESVFFTADYIADQRDFRLYHEVAEGGNVLLVVRNFQNLENLGEHEELNRYTFCRPKDGYFTVAGALAAARFVIRDGVHLFQNFRTCEPPHFFKIATLPYRRAVLRAFFTRFHPKYFWGRDDYNVEHILRRQELNRIGGKSYGINHGWPAMAIIQPMWRYISYDRYYVFGRAIYDTHWKDTWAVDDLIPVGTFGATREDYAGINKPKPKNILIFTSVFAGNDKIIKIVRALGEAFPDRKIIFSIKQKVKEIASTRRVLEASMEGLPNVVDVSENLFALFRQAQYAFSDASTTVIEALQFGVTSFFIDVSDKHRACYYRRYPDLCVSSPEEAVERIRAIESGEWAYPRESFGDLVDLSGRVFFDVVRKDVGLPPKNETAASTEAEEEKILY